MGLLISYNAIYGRKIIDSSDMVRINTAWFSWDELMTVLQELKKPKFIDIHRSRTKGKVADHDFDMILDAVRKFDVEWIGISNVTDGDSYKDIRERISDKTRVCAKVESQKGYENYRDIMKNYDGIMVDVEDLASDVGWNRAIGISREIYNDCEKEGFPWFKLQGVIFEFGNSERVVYTYGAWDLLHPGHINMLETARSLGDKLVVGVVGDEAIRELKGEGRPTQSQEDRLRIIKLLRCVDEAMIQETYDPVPNLEKVHPEILVKGDDWEKIPGEEWVKEKGRKLIKPKYSKGWSTSGTLKKIKDQK